MMMMKTTTATVNMTMMTNNDDDDDGEYDDDDDGIKLLQSLDRLLKCFSNDCRKRSRDCFGFSFTRFSHWH